MFKVDCIFCRIINGEVPTYKVFEDDKILAFLDVNPLSRGHTLIIPKVHVARFEDLEWEDANALFRVIYELVEKVQEAVNAPASTVAINNGVESGQEIPHVHFHLIPRFKNDGGGPIHAIMREKPQLTRDEMIQIAERISNLSI